MRALLVSSFVGPHVGGVERFVATVAQLLGARGWEVRVLACRREGEDGTADAVVPARFVGRREWPMPTGGWRTLEREVAGADVVIANNALHPLSDLSVLLARRRSVPRLLVVHGSGQPRGDGAAARGGARTVFQRTLARLAVRRALVVSVSATGVQGVRDGYGVGCAHLPYPLPALPAAEPRSAPAPGAPLRTVWVGRLADEKDPLAAVEAVARLRARRPATLDVYGDGPLRGQLASLAAQRPWLTVHGSRAWAAILAVQGSAHACLSTSVWDNVQVAVLEALVRGVPVLSTRVGDAPRHYRDPALRRFCVAPRDAGALAAALDELAAGYDAHRRAFADNATRLRAVHDGAADVLEELIADAGRGRSRR